MRGSEKVVNDMKDSMKGMDLESKLKEFELNPDKLEKLKYRQISLPFGATWTERNKDFANLQRLQKARMAEEAKAKAEAVDRAPVDIVAKTAEEDPLARAKRVVALAAEAEKEKKKAARVGARAKVREDTAARAALQKKKTQDTSDPKITQTDGKLQAATEEKAAAKEAVMAAATPKQARKAVENFKSVEDKERTQRWRLRGEVRKKGQQLRASESLQTSQEARAQELRQQQAAAEARAARAEEALKEAEKFSKKP